MSIMTQAINPLKSAGRYLGLASKGINFNNISGRLGRIGGMMRNMNSEIGTGLRMMAGGVAGGLVGAGTNDNSGAGFLGGATLGMLGGKYAGSIKSWGERGLSWGAGKIGQGKYWASQTKTGGRIMNRLGLGT